jgi:hypothetical protein
MHFAGREFAGGSPPSPDVMFFRAPGFDEHRDWDAPRGEAAPRFEGRHPQGKKPQMKKPAARKPEMKMGAERRDFEARLAALERQQAQILSVLQMLASEHKSKELARGGKDARHGEKKPRHEDRD